MKIFMQEKTHLARLWTEVTVIGRQPLTDSIPMEQMDSEIEEGTTTTKIIKTQIKPNLIIFPFGFILARPV